MRVPRLRHRALIVPIALAALAGGIVALLATGHGGDATTRPLDRPFMLAVDRLCAREAPLLESRRAFPYRDFDPEHPRAAELPAVGAYYAPRLGPLRDLTRRLAALGDPADDRAQWRALRTLAAAYVETAARQVVAASRRDTHAFIRTVARIGGLRDAIANAALALGFGVSSRCARGL